MANDRMTALDSSFLHLEDNQPSHMHVASVTIFEGPAPDYNDFVDGTAARLALVPRYRQKLGFVPFGQGRPRWVDDPTFNICYHVRATALPPPGVCASPVVVRSSGRPGFVTAKANGVDAGPCCSADAVD